MFLKFCGREDFSFSLAMSKRKTLEIETKDGNANIVRVSSSSGQISKKAMLGKALTTYRFFMLSYGLNRNQDLVVASLDLFL